MRRGDRGIRPLCVSLRSLRLKVGAAAAARPSAPGRAGGSAGRGAGKAAKVSAGSGRRRQGERGGSAGEAGAQRGRPWPRRRLGRRPGADPVEEFAQGGELGGLRQERSRVVGDTLQGAQEKGEAGALGLAVAIAFIVAFRALGTLRPLERFGALRLSRVAFDPRRRLRLAGEAQASAMDSRTDAKLRWKASKSASLRSRSPSASAACAKPIPRR